MKELYFVRHGQTEWNATRRMQGQWNSNLNELGQQQAEQHGRFLQSLDIQYLVASPLDRTRQTAEIINQYLDLDINFDERLKEWDSGAWSGYLYADIPEKWPVEWAAWQADHFHYRGPDCENYPDMIDRVSPFLHDLHQVPHDRIAVVSHGMIGGIMVGMLLGFSEKEMLGFHQTNDTVFRLSITGETFQVNHYIGGVGPSDGLPARDG